MKLRKWLTAGIFVVALAGLVMPSYAADTTGTAKDTVKTNVQKKTTGYIASKDGKSYHKPSCALAKNIKPENLVTFKTKAEAEKAGYSPCKVCFKA